MEPPPCPFCGTGMRTRDHALLAEHFQQFTCPQCLAELKRPLTRDLPEKQAPLQTNCGDCAFSDLQCGQCGDGVCEKHVHTFEKYGRFLDPELAEGLKQTMGTGIFCPLCFQSTTFSLIFAPSGKPLVSKASCPDREISSESGVF